MADPLTVAQANADLAIGRADRMRQRAAMGRFGDDPDALPDDVAQALARTLGPIKFLLDTDLQQWLAAFEDVPVTVDLLLKIQMIRLLRGIADGAKVPAQAPDSGGVVASQAGAGPSS